MPDKICPLCKACFRLSLSFLMLISLLLIHILLHIKITTLFLYLMAKAAFYGRLTERQKESVCSRTTMPVERIQLLLCLVVSETNNWAVAPILISQANCLLCGPSGGNNCVFSLFGSLPFSYIYIYSLYIYMSSCSLMTAPLSNTDFYNLHTSRITWQKIYDAYL